MDINGLIVAASETIRFEGGNGKLITGYSLWANFHFYILITEELIESWEEIHVSHFYKFTHLKLAAIELVSGARKSVLETTEKSHFHEIEEHEARDCNSSGNLIKKISAPGISLELNGKAESKLISYQGIVTKVEDSNLGLYELDNKIQLYCIFNSFRAPLPVLREDVKVFVSNAHYFIDFRGTKVLVCCGLSSLMCMDSKVEKTDSSLSTNLNQYSLSIYDILWLQMLLKKLISKFCPSVVSNESLFHLESKIINNILECFTDLPEGLLVPDKKSLCEEYCSSPHSCSLFVDDILPTGCEILNIAEILDDVFSNTSFTKMTDSWETCFAKNSKNFILIGFLYLSKDGCWYIMDKSCNIPVVLTQSCDKCKSSGNISCLFNDLNLGYLIAVQNFSIVFERIKYQFNNYYNCRYLKIPCCFLFNLGTFYKDSADSFQFISELKPCNLRLKSDSRIDEITSMIEELNFEKKDVMPSERKNSLLALQDDITTFTSQNILVLSKLWTVVEDKFVCYQVIALLLPEEVDNDCFDSSNSLFGNNRSFFENEESDDEEFAELINQMDSLLFEDKPRLARFHFESTRQCALLMPGHMYTVNLSEKLNQDIQFLMECDKGNSKPLFMKIKPSVLITHHLHCLGNHEPDSNIYYGIKQIISERKVQENSLIKAVLKDKLFEERNSISQSEDCRNLTFCLIVQDCSSNDTLKVYLPFCPKNIYGFLPGMCLLMYGFVCVCSKRGNLYLIQSSSFGIQVLNTEESFMIDICDRLEPEKVPSDEDLSISSVRNMSAGDIFKCLCYIIKIVSVKVHLICNSCSRGFEEKCSCLCSYSIKLSMSFIIDDGVDQVTASCSDETAKKILMFSEYEWKKLTTYVTTKMTSLKFHCKEDNECDSSSLMNQVFSLYCASKFLCRQTCLKCKKISGGTKNDLQSIWCCDILKEHELDLIPEFIKRIKSIDTYAR